MDNNMSNGHTNEKKNAWHHMGNTQEKNKYTSIKIITK